MGLLADTTDVLLFVGGALVTLIVAGAACYWAVAECRGNCADANPSPGAQAVPDQADRNSETASSASPSEKH